MAIYNIDKPIDFADYIIESERNFDTIIEYFGLMEDSTTAIVPVGGNTKDSKTNNNTKDKSFWEKVLARLKAFGEAVIKWFKNLIEKGQHLFDIIKTKMLSWITALREKYQKLTIASGGYAKIDVEGYNFTPEKVPDYNANDAEKIINDTYKMSIKEVLHASEDELNKIEDIDPETIKAKIRKMATGKELGSDQEVSEELFNLYRNGGKKKKLEVGGIGINFLIRDANDGFYRIKSIMNRTVERGKKIQNLINDTDATIKNAESRFTQWQNEEGYTIFSKAYGKFRDIIGCYKTVLSVDFQVAGSKYIYYRDMLMQQEDTVAYLMKIGVLIPKNQSANASYLDEYLDRVIID